MLILLPFYETINIFTLEIHVAFTADNVTFVDVADDTIRSLRSTLTRCACATHFMHCTCCTRLRYRTHYTITATTVSHHSKSSSSLADQRIMPTSSCRHLLVDIILSTSSCRHLLVDIFLSTSSCRHLLVDIFHYFSRRPELRSCRAV